jgi:hypothetical protein
MNFEHKSFHLTTLKTDEWKPFRNDYQPPEGFFSRKVFRIRPIYTIRYPMRHPMGYPMPWDLWYSISPTESPRDFLCKWRTFCWTYWIPWDIPRDVPWNIPSCKRALKVLSYFEYGQMGTLPFPSLAVYYWEFSLMPQSDIFFGWQTNCRNDYRSPEWILSTKVFT